jgi:CheY-like chemotaxis protein
LSATSTRQSTENIAIFRYFCILAHNLRRILPDLAINKGRTNSNFIEAPFRRWKVSTNMKAVIITNNGEERILLTHVVERAGLLVQPTDNFDSVVQGWPKAPADLVILAQASEQLQDALHQARLVTPAPIIVVTDFINDRTRVALYEAGADLVLVRPYSPRLLMVQAGIMAQQGHGRSSRQPTSRTTNRSIAGRGISITS